MPLTADPAGSARIGEQAHASRERWFKDARFGMFIHFGLFTLLGRDCWVQYLDQIPVNKYAKLKDQFNPVEFNAKEWVQIAKDAGQRYITLVSKHHEGFALFNTKLSDFNIMRTPFGRDLCGELAEECHRQGVTISFYFSMMDWYSPLYQPSLEPKTPVSQDFIDFMHGQVRELCTHYGKLGVLWFDGQWDHSPEQWQVPKLIEMIHKLQPDALINNRLGRDADPDLLGDFNTPEVAGAGVPKKAGRMWEQCTTLNDNWGYSPADTRFKTSRQVVHMLVRAVAGGMACHYGDPLPSGGNLLLNVGPMASGRIPAPEVTVLREVGDWLKVNGESIYGADSFSTMYQDGVFATAKGDKVYLHVFDWVPGAGCDFWMLRIKDAKRAYFLETGQAAEFTRQYGFGIRLRIRNSNPKPSPDTIVVFEGVEAFPR